MRAFLYLRRGHGSFSFCCARSLRSRRCASKCVRSFPGLRRQDLQRIFQQAERRPAGPAFCFTLPETACHGAPLSWIGRRLPNAKCTAAFSIARLKRGSASAQRAPCLGAVAVGIAIKGARLTAAFASSGGISRQVMPPASFALLLQICPLQGRSAKRGPICLGARRSTGRLTPSKAVQRSAGANRAGLGRCLPMAPLLLRIRFIAGLFPQFQHISAPCYCGLSQSKRSGRCRFLKAVKKGLQCWLLYPGA